MQPRSTSHRAPGDLERLVGGGHAARVAALTMMEPRADRP